MSDDWSGQTPQAAWPSNSGETAVEVEAAPAVELTLEEKNAAIQAWLKAKGELDAIKVNEATVRLDLQQALFPAPRKGTQRYTSPEGYGAIKLVWGWNFTLGDKDKLGDDGIKVPIADQVELVLDQIAALGPSGELLASRLVKWSPELSATEYEKLDPADPVQAKAKELIDAILTVKPASPQISFEPSRAGT